MTTGLSRLLLRCAAGLCVVLSGAGLQAVSSTPAVAQESCTDWADVTPYEGDGYTNFQHMLVVGQTQRCTTATGQQDNARVVLRHLEADPLTEYPLEGLRVLIRRHTDEHGGCWCEDVFNSGVIAEPGVGNTFASPAVPVTADNRYQASVQIYYVDAPTGYGQEGHQQWLQNP